VTDRGNLFADAPCCTPEHNAWIREHRASQWDYTIELEGHRDAEIRRKRSRRLCFSCPKKTECRDLRVALMATYDTYVSGIWAGHVYPDKEPHPEPVDALGLFSREESEAA
jgi:hypothetical protein